MRHWLSSPLTWTGSGIAFGLMLVVLSLSRGSGVLPPEIGTPAVAAAVKAPVPDRPELWQGKVDYAALDGRIRRMMNDPALAGLAVAAVENGRLSFVQGYGLGDREHAEPVTPETVFRWASVSKGVAGTLAYKLAEQGRLSLSEPLAGFHTSLRLPGGAEQRLAVPDLLAHRLGIARNAYDGYLEAGEPAATLRQSLAKVGLQCQPGDCHSYQNVAYDTMSEIVARATGHPYDREVETQLFAPLGMASAGLGMTNLTGAPHWARPYAGKQTLTLSDAYFRVPAAAGVSSNILDLARWMQAQMGEAPKAVSEAVRAEIQRPRVATPHGRWSALDQLITETRYGQGWRSQFYDGHWLVGHFGAVNGYRAAIWFDPALRSGIVMLWNSNAGRPFHLPYEFFDALYGRPYSDWVEIDRDPRFAVAAAGPIAAPGAPPKPTEPAAVAGD